MKVFSILVGYFQWHYGKALFSLSSLWGNFSYFVIEFFSIESLFKNFFSPWKRMADNYPRGFSLKKYFEVLITNLIVRVFGMIMRSGLLFVSLGCYFLLVILYPLLVVIWLLLPLLVLLLIGSGLFFIIK